MAGKPRSKSSQKKGYLAIGIIMYVLVLFVGAHIGKIEGLEGFELLQAAMDHIAASPFDVTPLNLEAIKSAAVIGLLPPLLLYTDYLRNRNMRPGEEHGSSKWNENLKKYYAKYAECRSGLPGFVTAPLRALSKVPVLGLPFKPLSKAADQAFLSVDKRPGTKNMIFSNDIYMSMNTRKTLRNNNVVVFGGSGTGKSRFVVKPNILQANCSYVITDPSGELLASEGEFLKSQGYEIRVFNLSQMEHSSCYNPFHYVRNQEGILTMINALIQNTTAKGSSSSDPFWEKAETALLEACCYYLRECVAPEEQNFANVMRLLRCARAAEGQEDVRSPLDIMFDDLKERDPENIAVQQYAVFKSAGGGKTAQSILISCQTRLQHFNLDAVKALTSTDTIDLGTIGDRKTALFCVTPVADSSFNFLVSLLYTQLFETLYFHAETDCKGMRLPVHVRFLLDEFANIGTIPEFDQKLATMRKYEISCTIILQALSQLKSRYKDTWEVLIGNCDSFLFIGGSDMETLKYVSDKLGDETIRVKGTNRSRGKQGSYGENTSVIKRKLLEAAELAMMDNRNCVLFIRGEYPFFSEKYKLEQHPNYGRSGDADDKYLYDVKTLLTRDEAEKGGSSDGHDGDIRERELRKDISAACTEGYQLPPRPRDTTNDGRECWAPRDAEAVAEDMARAMPAPEPDSDAPDADGEDAAFQALKDQFAAYVDGLTTELRVPSDPDEARSAMEYVVASYPEL